jgi:hypothetical protein
MSLRVLLIAFLLSLPLAVNAGAVRTLDWGDLAPPADDLLAPFADFNDDQLATASELYSLHEWQRKNSQETGGEGVLDDIKRLTADLESQNLDVAALLAKIDKAMIKYRRRQQQPIEALDGQHIRLPGYVLPLEFNGEAVSEFFLVPTVGACIHTPPPPANQIVLVKLNQSFTPSGIFDAVWVSGRMKVVTSRHKLGYRDGAGEVSSTYQMEAVQVTPYGAE